MVIHPVGGKAVPDGSAEAGYDGSGGNKTHAFSAKKGLQAIPEVLGDEVSLNHGIPEIGDAHFLALPCPEGFEGVHERVHASILITIFYDTGIGGIVYW